MQTRQLLQYLAVLGAITLGGNQRAFAQEDESWYKAHLKKQRLLQQSNVSGSQQKQMTTLQRSNCDLSTNGDMETQLNPPSRTGNMGGQLTYSNSPDELANWYSPTYATPDYQATNATFFDVNPQLEYGFSGSSTPHSGIGEVGLYSRQAFTEADGTQRDRTSEYATAPLAAGPNGLENARYYAEVWVSLSHATGTCNYGVNNGFGMWFTPNDNFKTLTNRDFLPTPTSPFLPNTSPISQNAINYGNLGSTTWQRISGQFTGNGEKFVTLGLFNSDPANLVLLPGKNANRLNTYIYADDFQIYKIPVAGPNATVACGQGLMIGEGCDIPNAKYAWTIQGSSAPAFATTIQTPVNQKATTTYVLTVTLPDGSTYATTTTVTGNNALPDSPVVSRTYPQYEDCYRVANYSIDNFDPNSTYTVTWVSNATPYPAHPQTNAFFVRGAGNSTNNIQYGRFIITATNSCGSTSSEIDVEYDCATATPGYRSATTSTAYPNPATEILITSGSGQNATLLDSQGNTVGKADSAGQIDVHSLPAGLYNLRVERDGKIINQHIQVQH